MNGCVSYTEESGSGRMEGKGLSLCHFWTSMGQPRSTRIRPVDELESRPCQKTTSSDFMLNVRSHQNCMHCGKKSGHNSIKNPCVSSPVLFATEHPATPPGWYKMDSRQSNPDSRAQQKTLHRAAQRGQGYAMAADRNNTTFQNLRQDINQLVQVSQEVAVLRWDALERRQKRLEPDPRYADEVAPSFFDAASRPQPPMMSLGREHKRQP